MKQAVKIEDVFTKEFIEELKTELPKATELMQHHMVSFMVDEVASFIYENFPESRDPIRDSRDILLKELGDCCQMFRTVCEGEPSAFCICNDKVYRLNRSLQE